MVGYYSYTELNELGLREFGENVFISKKASIYLPEWISIGHNVRIDDFCVLIGNIRIENHVHIGSFCSLHASKGAIIFQDYSGISSNVTIYACSDDYSGYGFTARPGIPDDWVLDYTGNIILGKYSQIGTGCTVLPKGSLGEGTAVGAMSLINKPLRPWTVYIGIPCKKYSERKQDMKNMVSRNMCGGGYRQRINCSNLRARRIAA